MSLRLRSINLRGFKSFGERVHLEFQQNINAIIGPNGSGKSNVIEAIRWVTHSARSRELRARAATELIFHGTMNRPGLGFAEVELELEELLPRDLAGNAPTAFGISRRLYRDGEGELEVAGRPSRVRDLHDRLAGSGLGPGGLAIIGQGEVGQIVGASPEDMLGYLEEAAGVSRASLRRQQALERLANARTHLEAAETLATERRERVGRLELAASLAREVRVLELERGQLELALFDARSRALNEEIHQLNGALELLEVETSAAGQDINSTRLALEALRLERDAAGNELTEVKTRAERLSAELRHAREQNRLAQESLENHARERLAIQQEATLLRQTPEPDLPEEPQEDLPQLELELRLSEAKVEALLELERQAKIQLETARAEHIGLERDRASVREQNASLSAERQSLERDLLELETELQALQLELDQVTEHEVLQERTSSALEEQRSLERTLAETKTSLDDLRSQINLARAERAPLEREFVRLEASLQGHTRFAEGPRRALESGIPGVLGSVADFLKVEGELELAVQVALGRRLEYVVVETGETARRVIEELKRVGGRATFLPLDLLTKRVRRPLPIGEGVLGWLADLVGGDMLVREHLMLDTLVVQTLDHGLIITKRERTRPRIVTLTGELLEASGAISGGRGRETSSGILADRRRFEELQAELATIGALVEGLEARVLERTEACRDTEIRLQAARLTATEAQAAAQKAQSRREYASARHEDVRQRLERLVARRVGLGAALELPERALPDLAVLDEAMRAASLEAEGARAALGHARLALQAARAADALHFERLRTFEQAQARRSQAFTRLTAIEARLAELDQLDQALEHSCKTAHRNVQDLEGELAALGLTATEERLSVLELRRRELEHALTRQTTRLGEAQRQLDETRLARARREASLESHLAKPPVEIDGPRVEPAGTARQWGTRLGLINSRIDEIGLVNPLAESEFRTEQEQLERLVIDLNEAQASVEELEQALIVLERDVGARLEAAAERVAVAFRLHAAELLGGESDLELLRDERGDLVGLALQVTPKGKRTRALHLLSTGERTMAALAFLFALSSAPPEAIGLPIAILDEVDAPLDEANIRRFCHFLRDHAARGTQFVLVTHQKATMEVADAIYGVTTEAGVSRLYSIQMV